MAVSGDRPVLAITNAEAGGASASVVRSALDALRARRDVRVEATESPDDLDRVLAGLGERLPVVVGGDGSVHAVVAGLWRRRRPGDLHRGVDSTAVGVIPLGTGNDLARALGLPLDPLEAAGVVLDGRERPLDLLVDDAGDVVVNAVHAGVGAEAARLAESWKRRLHKAAYPAGAVVAGVRARGWRLRVEVDGDVLAEGTARVLMVGVGNGTSIGGGSELTPEAAPDDGAADVVVSAAVGPLARVGFAVRMPSGRHLQRPDVVLGRGRVVTVTGQPFRLNADGEIGDPVTARTWTVHRHAWRAIVPR